MTMSSFVAAVPASSTVNGRAALGVMSTTAAVVDITPNAARPFTVDEAGTSAANEDIVIGRSRGERRANGDYHGHITAAALFGN